MEIYVGKFQRVTSSATICENVSTTSSTPRRRPHCTDCPASASANVVRFCILCKWRIVNAKPKPNKCHIGNVFSSNIYSSVRIGGVHKTLIHALSLSLSVCARLLGQSGQWQTSAKISNRKILPTFLIKFKICSTLNCSTDSFYYFFSLPIKQTRPTFIQARFVRSIDFHLLVCPLLSLLLAREWRVQPLFLRLIRRVFI